MSKLETNTIDTVSGTSTLQVGSTNTTTITLGASGDTINIPSGATIANSGTATGFYDGTPMVSAYLSSSQNISDATWTKIQINTEVIDTDNAFDNSTNYRFTVPSGKAGKYFISGSAQLDGNNNDVAGTWIAIAINGARDKAGSLLYMPPSTGSSQARVQNAVTIQDLSVGDTVELQAYIDVNSGTPFIDTSGRHTQINIFKIG